MAPWLISRIINRDLWAISHGSFGYKTKQKLISKPTHDKTQLHWRQGTGPVSTGCVVYVKWRRTRAKLTAQDPVTPVSTLCRLPYFVLLGLSHETGGLPEHISHSLERLLSSILTRKSLVLHHLLPSLANHHENHIIKGGVKGRRSSLE